MGAYTRSDPDEIQKSMERAFVSFPRLKERIESAWRNTFRRRTANAGNSPWNDEQTFVVIAG